MPEIPDSLLTPRSPAEVRWVLRLYVAGKGPACQTARRQLKQIEAEHLPPFSSIEVIDLEDDPDAAEKDGILAIPTLVRRSPPPVRRIIGDLSNTSRVLCALGFSTEIAVVDG